MAIARPTSENPTDLDGRYWRERARPFTRSCKLSHSSSQE